MKIGEAKPNTGARGAAAVADARPAAAAAAAYAGAAKPVQPAADSAAVMGIPEAEFTPKVRAAIMALMAEVDKLRRELAQTQARIGNLEQLADQDTLTPVANRRAFVRELSRMMSFAERYRAASSVIYFDVNGLKAINDTNGHAAGDAVLSSVAKTLIDNVRDSDMVGRLGGDEFGVILAYADETQAAEKAADLAAEIAKQPLDWKGVQLPVSVSYGVHSFSTAEDAAKALDKADRAMYAQKKTTPTPR